MKRSAAALTDGSDSGSDPDESSGEFPGASTSRVSDSSTGGDSDSAESDSTASDSAAGDSTSVSTSGEREEFCLGLHSTISNDDGGWRCTRCFIDMGPTNPRQLCGKTHCNSLNYCHVCGLRIRPHRC